MRVGFTGTRGGMTAVQKQEFKATILQLNLDEFHHGDCVGADEDAHYLVIENFDCQMVGHPPTNTMYQAHCSFDRQLPPMEYLARNRGIVNTTDILIACPKEEAEILRSGTWSTVRYARKQKKQVIIIPPTL